jgi:hypothetical protein
MDSVEAFLVHELREWRREEGQDDGFRNHMVQAVFTDLMDLYQARSSNNNTTLTFMLAAPIRPCVCPNHTTAYYDDIRRSKQLPNDMLTMVMDYFTMTEEASFAIVSKQFRTVIGNRWDNIKERLKRALGMVEDSMDLWFYAMGKEGKTMKDVLTFLQLQGLKEAAEDSWVYTATVPYNKARRARHVSKKRARYEVDESEFTML